MSAMRFTPFLITGLALTAGAGWWATRSMPIANLAVASSLTESENASEPEPSHATSRQLSALDTRPFTVPLWAAPPAPPPPPVIPSPPPPPLPLRVQLIAIVREPATDTIPAALSVLFYDPDTDRLLSMKEGDPIGGRTITRIAPDSVELREGAGTRTLALSDDPAKSAGGMGGGR